MTVRLITITPEAEKIIAYCARVSSPNQENPEISHLLRYMIAHKHWSPMEQASMTVEIETSRMISAQILRHRSFVFQEFSQRYAEAQEIVLCEARRQDTKNRQNSIDDLSDEIKKSWNQLQEQLFVLATEGYKWALDNGIAKECARAVLPMQTKTKLYMTGSIRSWIHYLELRTGPDTQKEHRDIANEIKEIFDIQMPVIADALGW